MSQLLSTKNKINFNYLAAALFFVLAGGILAVQWLQGLYIVIPVPFFLTLHIILEFLGVVVSIAVFIVAWYNFRQTRTTFDLAISLTFLSVGILVFAHTMSYNGMPEFFTVNSVNKASTFWIISRLVLAVGLFTATAFNLDRVVTRVNPLVSLLCTLVFVTAVLVIVVSRLDLLLPMYADGRQTELKVILEYVVICLEAINLVYLSLRKKSPANYRYIKAALLFGIFSELSFTLYSSAYDTYNLIGHLYQIGVFICILRGLFVSSVVSLYQANRVLREQRRKLSEVNAQLERVNQLKTDFLANTNHELRTPLTAIIAFTELLLDRETGPLNDVQKDYLHEINDSSQKLLVEINNLLDLSRIEAGRVKLFLEPVSFPEIINQVISQLDPLFRLKNQQVTISLGTDLPIVHVDTEKVRKIMVNLLSNAHKFSPVGGLIRLSVLLSQDGRYVVVSLKDDGIGMTESQMEHVFEKFYQAESSLTRQQHGTGLGLTLVKHFVELHGGSIWVESAPDQGSTFSFRVPLQVSGQEAV